MQTGRQNDEAAAAEPLQRYRSALEREQQHHDLNVRNWRWVAFLRGGLFLLALSPLIAAAGFLWGMAVPWLWLSGALMLVFLAVAFYHELMSRQIRRSRLLIRMHRESIARMQRDWASIRAPAVDVAKDIAPISNDLDLYDEESLWQLLAIVRTPFGVRILAEWTDAAVRGEIDWKEIAARQTAVEELRDQHTWRTVFRLRCEQLAASQAGPSQFVKWAESKNWLPRRAWLLWLCRLTALTTGISILLMIFGVVPLSVSGPILLGTVAVNFFISVFFAGTIHNIFNQISSHRDEISHYQSLFAEVIAFDCQSPFLNRIQRRLGSGESGVRGHIKSLGLLNGLANMRRDGVFFILYLLLEFLVMWDVHVLERLESWKTRHGSKARGWFEALGQWESILALSKLAHDHPNWTLPTSASPDHASVLSARQLGHPLMDEYRVPNDVEVGPAGTVLLVTGSNMSGKSTLLRSIGVNAVLAQMGSVVCAEQLQMPLLRLETSMRIVDSLASGTSFFMAELKRLKEIVYLSKQAQIGETSGGDQPRLLFLLDEILQGTNSRERQIAVSRVVESLIRHGSIGAISTHDLELATTEELKAACVPVHFSEQFETVNGQRRMTFDYRMRRGISETTNALKLLEMVGLGEAGDESGP